MQTHYGPKHSLLALYTLSPVVAAGPPPPYAEALGGVVLGFLERYDRAPNGDDRRNLKNSSCYLFKI
jgi:hypothetical protein